MVSFYCFRVLFCPLFTALCRFIAARGRAGGYWLLAVLLLTWLLPQVSYAGSGFEDNYVSLSVGAPGQPTPTLQRYYANLASSGIPAFGGADLGTFSPSMGSRLYLQGAEVNTYSYALNGVQIETLSAQLLYRLYPAGSSPGPFTMLNLPYQQVGPSTYPNGKQWVLSTANVDLLARASQPGRYVLEVYFQAQGTLDGGAFTNYDDQNKANYKATFTVTAPGEGLIADSTEARVLHQLYLATGGDNWNYRANWPMSQAWSPTLTNLDYATWQGVTVTNHDITALDLNSRNMQGQLPSSIGLLTGLTYLNLPNCPGLTGPLPGSIGQLRNLTYLRTTRSLFTGPLPVELAQLTQLQRLYVDQSSFSGPIPTWLGNLTNLTELDLETNQFTGTIPKELGKLTKLQSLVLSNYYNIPPGRGNKLTGGIPPELGQLINLTFLDLSLNPLGGTIPKELGNLKNLTFLELDDCHMEGAIPLEVMQLPNLGVLVLGSQNVYYHDYNKFTSLPDPSLVPNKAKLRLNAAYNQFEFGQLEPYFSGPGQMTPGGGNYQPQSLPQDEQLVRAKTGQAASIASQIGGAHTHYQWQRQIGGTWTDLAGAMAAAYKLVAATRADTGRYRCQATNEWVTGITLTTRVYVLDVYDALPANLPDDTNTGVALVALSPAPDAQASKPTDMNFVRTWIPQQALTTSEPPLPGTGQLLREFWANVPGGNVSDIPFQQAPTSTSYLTSLEGPSDQGDYYGERYRGYLTPTKSGTYTFWISGDNNSQFWFSMDADPTHILLRADVPDGTTWREWNRYAEQKSVGLELVAGRHYYFEVRHKEAEGHDNVAVAWQRVGDVFEGPIPGAYLAPFILPPGTPTAPVVAADAPTWTVDQAQITTQYLDGLGRPVQTVLHQASPKYRDLVHPQAYDALGRETKQYLPYPADTAGVHSGGYRYQALTDQQAFYHRTALVGGGMGPFPATDPIVGVARTGRAYAETQFDNSPLNRVVAQGAAGEAWQLGAGHDQHRIERPNTQMDSVLRFTPGYDPRSVDPGYQGFYAAGELWGTQTSDEHGARVLEWKDKLGQVVLKQVEGSRPDTSRTISRRWLRTAYVYDDFQRLRFVLQPEATKRVLAAGDKSAMLPNQAMPFLFHYRYDGRGRQIAKQVPGQDGETLVVYDQLDRPVLSQDAQQRTRKEWSWTKYDALGRSILSGLVTRQDTMGQVRLQAIATADTAISHQYEQRTADTRYPQHYTTDQSFPQLGQQGFLAGQVLSATYYDDYDFDNNGQADASYSSNYNYPFPAGTAPVADEARTTGLVTRTLTNVLNRPTSDPGVAWLQTTTFYDERARPVQVQTINARGGHDLFTTQLDFTGRPVKAVNLHRGLDSQPMVVVEAFAYDQMGRLLASAQQLPTEAKPTQLSLRHYNEIGQLLVDSMGTGRLAQQVDYAYNIRGWLTSLNNPFDPNPKDLFNLSLHYELGFSKGYEQYNGNLTGQTWRGRDGVQRAYGYVYDPLNRLQQGDFVARAGGSAGTLTTATAWNTELDNYRLNSISYDDNGNINTLRRWGLLKSATHATAKQYGAVDNLTYAYVGNRLQAVDDAVTGNQLPRPTGYNGAPTSLAGDFQEQGVKLGQEYFYDANGNLTQDKNKGITAIKYNHLNLPRQIQFGSGADSVVFRYSAAGQKVAKLVYQTGKPLGRTDYLGPYQYEQDSLKFFPHAEGRVLQFVSKDPAGGAHVSYQREFTIKDHLGNLRLAYRAGQRRTYVASLEQDDNTRKRETQQFDSLSVSPPIAQNVGNNPATNHAYSGTYAARLNAGGSNRQPLGPLTQIGVQKGDTLQVSAPGFYPQAVSNNSFAFSLASFVASLLQPTAATPTGADGRKRGGLPLLQVGLNAAGLTALTQLNGVPKGYLRVLVFNTDSVLIDQRTLQLSRAALNNYEVLHDTLTIKRDGYVTVYVGNESEADVYFDDVTVEHRQGLQVQETQYDPAGMELAGLAPPSPGIRGLNNYRFNGKEFQMDLGLNWNHQDWRFFDPQLLRWHAGDPELENGQESWTPYSFGYDNAIRYADGNGREPGDGGGPSAFGIIYNTVIGAGLSIANTFLIATDANPIYALNGGPSYRGSISSNGEVTYGQRAPATSNRQNLIYVASDGLEMASAGLTLMSLGGLGAAGRALPMGAGMLFEQGAGKVAQNEVVQEGQAALKQFSGTAHRLDKGATPNSIYTHLNKNGTAQNNYIYNQHGELHAEVNFQQHGKAKPGHGHIMEQAGDAGSGHGRKPGKHIKPADVPIEWQKLPDGIKPLNPVVR
jgi:RHS repeat-associated protein